MEETVVSNGSSIKLQPYGDKYNGKHYGWAYQFLNDNYEGIHLGVCCKDFLQDIVWSELTQKTMIIYNQTSAYLGILDKQETLKLCIYPYLFNGVKEPKIANIEELAENLNIFLNEIECMRNYGFSIVFAEQETSRIIIEFSKQWIEKPMIFSLFTMFCRIGLYYNGNLEDYLYNLYTDMTNKPYLDISDRGFMLTNIIYILLFIDNEVNITQPDWIELTTSDQVHYSGFFSNLKHLKYAFNKE